MGELGDGRPNARWVFGRLVYERLSMRSGMYAFGKFIGSRLGIKVQKLRFDVLRTSKATRSTLFIYHYY